MQPKHTFILLVISLLACAKIFALPKTYSAPPAAPSESFWKGYADKLNERGIKVYPTLILDSNNNLGGGLHRTKTFPGQTGYWLDLGATMHSEPLLKYRGGLLYLDLQTHQGASVTQKDVGAFVPLDDISSFSFYEVASLWYKQSFKNGRFWLLAGKSDAYEHFTLTAYSTLFINVGFIGLAPIRDFPTYPNPAMSLIGYAASPKKALSLTAGVFDGSLAQGVNTGKRFFGEFFHNLSSHAFLIAQLDIGWLANQEREGRFAFGLWRNTSTFTRFNGALKKGTAGPYLTLNQTLYKQDQRNIGLFATYSSADPTINAAHYSLTAGLSCQGFTRQKDRIGFGASRTLFSSNARLPKSYEAAYELFYVWQFANWGYLQPDFQYIVNPGGQNRSSASVFTLRLQLSPNGYPFSAPAIDR